MIEVELFLYSRKRVKPRIFYISCLNLISFLPLNIRLNMEEYLFQEYITLFFSFIQICTLWIQNKTKRATPIHSEH